MIRFFIIKILICIWTLIPLLAECQTDSNRTDFPLFRLIEGDSAICYSLDQSRRIDAWLEEKDFLKGQYKLQKEALAKCEQLAESYDQLSSTYKLDAEYWKKIARKNNRQTAFVASGVGAVAAGVILYLVLKK